MSKMSSLRFNRCVDNALRHARASSMEFGGFSNAVLEYVFRLPYEERGTINSIVCSAEVKNENGTLDRIARINVNFAAGGFRKPHFFYIVAEGDSISYYGTYRGWKVIGRSKMMDGRITLPFEQDIVWLEPYLTEINGDKSKRFCSLLNSDAKPRGQPHLFVVK